MQDAVQSFQRGEERGFTYFFNAFYPALLLYAFKITGDRSAAEEQVGDSFIKIWERHHTFNHPKVIKSWLYTTVRNACINWLKAQQKDNILQEDLAIRLKNVFELPAQHDIIYTETIHELRNAVNSLPPRCQQVIKLLFIEGKTLGETALQLKLSVNTIKNQRARGLELLRKRAPNLIAMLFLLLQQ